MIIESGVLSSVRWKAIDIDSKDTIDLHSLHIISADLFQFVILVQFEVVVHVFLNSLSSSTPNFSLLRGLFFD